MESVDNDMTHEHDYPLPEEGHYLVEEGAQLVSSEVSYDHSLGFGPLQP